MGCLELPSFRLRLWRSKSVKPASSPEAKPAEKAAAKRVSLPHHIGTLAFERKKRDTREIAKRDSGKSGLSDMTFVDDDENAKRSSRLSTGLFKLSVDLKNKDELVDGLRYRGASVRRRDTVDTTDTLDSPLSPDSLGPDSPEEERVPKWKEEGLLDPEKDKILPEAEPAQNKGDAAENKETAVQDAALRKKTSIDNNTLNSDATDDDPSLAKEVSLDTGALKKEVDIDDAEELKRQATIEEARRKLELEEQEHRDFLQML